MSNGDRLASIRRWVPIPMPNRGFRVRRWFLLEGHRNAVTAALLLLTFLVFLLIGSVWTFEMQSLLTETEAVQTVLTTFMSGIILLVSIVVSINAIVISHDITAISSQEERVQSLTAFRQQIGRIAGTDKTPTDPASFLHTMATIIKERSQELDDLEREDDPELAEGVEDYVNSVKETGKRLEYTLDNSRGGEFRSLWVGLEMDYGAMMNRMREFTSTYGGELSESDEERFDELMELFELFATGQEYFKTLYYSREVTELSRTLLIISLPAIIVTAWAILAINANTFPEFWVLGLPPLLTFVAFIFSISLAPFIVLTSYMLRVATVTRRTAASGPFVLKP